MSINITTTGSYPPKYKALDASIRYALKAQISANLTLLVDGQVRSDIVGIFAERIGLDGDGLPYVVNRRIGTLGESVILPDLRTAARAAKGLPLKAHITGPTVIAENCEVGHDAPDIYKVSTGFRALVLDIAKALAEETSFIAAEAIQLNISYLQIDEPSLVFGANLKLAREGLELIADAWKTTSNRKIILHVCGDYGYIFPDLLKMPVDILNIEIEHLQELSDDQIKALKRSGKKISFGVIPVNTDHIPSPERVARELLYASDRCGMDMIWGITPVCGMRLSTPDLANKRMATLRQAAKILEGRRGTAQEVDHE